MENTTPSTTTTSPHSVQIEAGAHARRRPREVRRRQNVATKCSGKATSKGQDVVKRKKNIHNTMMTTENLIPALEWKPASQNLQKYE